MSYFERLPEGQIVMLCQICKTRCHADGPKQVYIPSGAGGGVRKAECPMCVCHDCVQLSDDPVRARLAPLVLGQTLEGGTRALGDGKSESRPGLLNIQDAIREIDPRLALKPVDPERAYLLESRMCSCGYPGVIRCISCSEPLCTGCHENRHCCPPPARRKNP